MNQCIKIGSKDNERIKKLNLNLNKIKVNIQINVKMTYHVNQQPQHSNKSEKTKG